jgi:cytochrome c oxidase cbb3-type subunit 3/ubiquinol-cytochrome c reductase cytochrome c subunit
MRLRNMLPLAMVIVALAAAAFALAQADNGTGISEEGKTEDVAGKPESSAEDAHKKAIKTGAGLYARYCAFCHGKKGEGFAADEANALANREFLRSATDDFIVQGIVRGRPGTPMSAWGKEYGGVLGDDDVSALLAFIRSWQVGESIEFDTGKIKGDAGQGAKTYAKLCASCHGDRGQGGMAVSLNNPVLHETASDGFLRYAIEKGRPGTPMPGYKRELLAGEIDNLVVYLRTLKADVKQGPIDEDVDISFSTDRLNDAVINPGGPPAEFTPRDGRFVPADDIHAAMEAGQSLIILDARPHNDYLKAHVEGAVSVPFYEVDQAVDHLPRDRWIITYCVCPHAMSGKALDRLREHGFEKTAILDEGFFEWFSRGYPVGHP